MGLSSIIAVLAGRARAFLPDRRANTAMMFGLSLVPILAGTGMAIDFARGAMVHQRMSESLDAAGLAVGNNATKPAACASGTKTDCPQALKDLANNYFHQNYDANKDESCTTPTDVGISIKDQAVTLTSQCSLNLDFMSILPLIDKRLSVPTVTVSASSTVVWGQTKLWVALVLDNSGSMSAGDKSGSKMDALQDAITNSSYGLLKTLQGASANAGDVMVGIVPFTRSVNSGLASSTAFLDWGEWEAPPIKPGTNLSYPVNNQWDTGSNPPATISFTAFGPGDSCPFTNSSNRQVSPFGFYCDPNPTNGGSSTSTIPSSGTYKGYICPGIDSGSPNSDHNDRYYNGCWTSAKNGSNTVRVDAGKNATCNGFSSSNCLCAGGTGSGRHCDTQAWTHVWKVNSHSTWSGCVMDRQQKNKQTTLGVGNGFRTASAYDYDETNTQPSNASSPWDDTQFPAENPASCPAAKVVTLSNDWTTLANDVKAMQPDGSTNQGIGVAHGWQLLTNGAPYATGALPSGTSKVMILFSDGLNTQDRWYGNGSTEGTTEDGYIDDRMKATCTAAKADQVTIYAIFVHIGTNGNSDALEKCASDATKYYDLTSSAQIKDAFSDIAQKITNLYVSK